VNFHSAGSGRNYWFSTRANYARRANLIEKRFPLPILVLQPLQKLRFRRSFSLRSLYDVRIGIEDVILRRCLDTQIVEQSEQLCAMICAMIRHMQQYLPQDKIFVFSFRERFFKYHIVPQLCKIVAHVLLNVVPVRTNAFPIMKVCGIEQFWEFDASQSAKPCIVSADEMNDLIANRPMRVVHSLRELFMG